MAKCIALCYLLLIKNLTCYTIYNIVIDQIYFNLVLDDALENV